MKIVITGNPGVGKHTISDLLAMELKYRILDINRIALESKTIRKSKEAIEVDTKQLKKVIENEMKNNSVIVGHLAPYVLTKSQIDKVVILRKSPYRLNSIYKKRGYSRAKILENLQSEILGIITYDALRKFGDEKSVQIDTTGKSVKKILKQVKSILKENVLREEVDWLGEISKKGDLGKFFPN